MPGSQKSRTAYPVGEKWEKQGLEAGAHHLLTCYRERTRTSSAKALPSMSKNHGMVSDRPNSPHGSLYLAKESKLGPSLHALSTLSTASPSSLFSLLLEPAATLRSAASVTLVRRAGMPGTPQVSLAQLKFNCLHAMSSSSASDVASPEGVAER